MIHIDRYIDVARVLLFLDEVATGEHADPTSLRAARHPSASLGVGAGQLDKLRSRLCAACADLEASDRLTERSLELQIWWRDYKANDAGEAEEEIERADGDHLRRVALSKLSPAERDALGVEEGP